MEISIRIFINKLHVTYLDKKTASSRTSLKYGITFLKCCEILVRIGRLFPPIIH